MIVHSRHTSHGTEESIETNVSGSRRQLKKRDQPDSSPPKAIFFDAAGTLIYLPKSVGYHYALVARQLGLSLDPETLDRAFVACWKQTPSRPAIEGPRFDDDKGWWRDLVDRMLNQVAPNLPRSNRNAFFETAYSHFAEAGVWKLYPEVIGVLEDLSPRFELAIISNFDGRLRTILSQLGASRFFSSIFLSSELGADKPDPAIYHRSMQMIGRRPSEVVHVGDDPIRDWQGAETVGIRIFRLQRPQNSLRNFLETLTARS